VARGEQRDLRVDAGREFGHLRLLSADQARGAPTTTHSAPIVPPSAVMGMPR
jgi:hypothetical protein